MEYNKNYIKNLLPNRPENSHKGIFGHVLNVAGSQFYTGAAYFSSISALKVGAGRTTLLSTPPVLSVLGSLCPDIILYPSKAIKNDFFKEFQAISIGCGLSQEVSAVKLFKKIMNLLKNSEVPVVIDADGLNILSKIREIKLPQNTILTPHPKEMSRLMGASVYEILENPETWVKECAEKYRCTVVLKLHKTLVADNQGNFYENSTGNSALAHGGSGDILCGMITGFLAQGTNIFNSCCLAIYLHGLAGELASEDLTQYSVLASDLLDYIPKAIKTILT